jgi:hypothetical protein
LGIKFQLNDKFAFFTGGAIKFFEWNIHGYSGGKGDTQTNANEWQVTGIKWDPEKSADGTGKLGIGMTFAPTENIIVGAGLNTLLDCLFTINPTTMEAEAGSWFTKEHNSPNFFGEFLELFKEIKFDLTVSFKFD